MKKILKALIPPSLHQTVLKWWFKPSPRNIRWGNLRRLQPVSRVFASDRGKSIDRFYIESFLKKNCQDIHGRVLEIGDATYTKEFGGKQVTHSEVLHAKEGNPKATIVGDLATGEGIPDDKFDCIILTQTFPFIYEKRKAISNCHKALRAGGVLLVTLPGISQISRYDMDRWGDFWRFTDASACKLFGDVFGEENVEAKIHGNVLAACAFLQGIAAEELREDELEFSDPDYQVLITLRAWKEGE